MTKTNLDRSELLAEHDRGDFPRGIAEAVERRFGARRAPSAIGSLSDNGASHIAKAPPDRHPATRTEALLHASRRPTERNGITEAFVKTPKRGQVPVTPSPDTQTVPGLIGGRIGDYNDNHPHSGLKMRAPREFIAARTATA
jgi:putative transposase